MSKEAKREMPTTKAMLITHPVRARILTALMGRPLTTQQIAALLPDIPLPSLYRHVRTLVEGGILKAVEEVRVNGALTKVYAVQEGQTHIHPADVRDASRADHLSYFTTFLNVLAETYRGYLEWEGADLSEMPVHSLMETLTLDREEYAQFMEALRAFLQPWREKTSGDGRHRLIFAHLIIPDRPDPPLS